LVLFSFLLFVSCPNNPISGNNNTESQPNIVVKQGETIIPNKKGFYNFGIINFSETKEIDFTIENISGQKITFSQNGIISTNTNAVTVIYDKLTDIEPNQKFNFKLKTTPISSWEVKTGSIYIKTNAGFYAFSFSLTGVITAPTTGTTNNNIINIKDNTGDVLIGTTYNFGNITFYSSKKNDFIIENKCDVTIDLNNLDFSLLYDNTSDFTIIKPTKILLKPNEMDSFSISFTPKIDGNRKTSFAIYDKMFKRYIYGINLVGGAIYPEIEIKVGDKVINSNYIYNQYYYKYDYDLGEVALYNFQKTTFAIENKSDVTIDLNNFDFNLKKDNTSDFLIYKPIKDILKPNEKATFDIVFKPKKFIESMTNIIIYEKVLEKKIREIRIKGNCSYSALKLRNNNTFFNNNYDFGTISVYDTKKVDFCFENSSDSIIDLSNIDFLFTNNYYNYFTVIKPDINTLKQNEKTNFSIVYSPKTEESIYSKFQIYDRNLKTTVFDIYLNKKSIIPSISIKDQSGYNITNYSYGAITSSTGSRPTFYLYNQSEAEIDLNNYKFYVSGDNSSDYSIIEPIDKIIEPYKSVSFSIVFNPKGRTERKAVFNLFEKRLNKIMSYININGTGLFPYMGVRILDNYSTVYNGNRYNIGTVSLKNRINLTCDIEIRNFGNDVLKLTDNEPVEIISDKRNLYLITEPSSKIINPGETLTFSIIYTPDDYANTAKISFKNKNNCLDNDFYFYIYNDVGNYTFNNRIRNVDLDCVKTDLENNVYVSGYTVNSQAYRTWYIKKFDKEGKEDTVNWNKTFDGTSDWASKTLIAIDFENNVYAFGVRKNLVSLDSKEDWWLKKFDKNGVEDTINWNKKMDGNNTYDYIGGVFIDSDNNVFVVGRQFGGLNNSYGLIKKFDKNGVEDTINWNKKIYENSSFVINCITIDLDKNVYVAGCGDNLVSSESESDWWIKKFDKNGVEDTANWNKKITNGNGSYFETVTSISIDLENNVYISGEGYDLISSRSGRDWWIKKFNKDGIEDVINWDKKMGHDYFSDLNKFMTIDKDNNIYIVGGKSNNSSFQDWWIKKFDKNGIEDTTNWNKIFDWNGNSDYATSITIDSENNIYVVGQSGNDSFIKKFTPTGEER